MRAYLVNRADVIVFCNEQILPVRREAGREYIETAASFGELIELRFVRRSEFSTRGWALRALLFWIVGIFGLFTPRYSSFTARLDCRVRFTEDPQTPQIFRFTHYYSAKGEARPAVVAAGGGPVQIENGFYSPDAPARRRRRLYRLFSWLARIVLIAALVCAVVWKTINM